MVSTNETIKRATISEDGLYRYALSRTWEGPIWSLAFIMLVYAVLWIVPC